MSNPPKNILFHVGLINAKLKLSKPFSQIFDLLDLGSLRSDLLDLGSLRFDLLDLGSLRYQKIAKVC